MPIVLHEKALMLLFAELANTASTQDNVFLGSPGTVAERANANGTTYWTHRYLDGSGIRREQYLGTLDDPEAIARVTDLRGKIQAANGTIDRVRILARAGFATADRKTYSTLASLQNHGLFTAGALLIGSHCFGILLNVLGVRAVPYSTEDADIARRDQLALPGVPALIAMLRETGINFAEVPPLARGGKSTTYAEIGGSLLKVDLLVPSSDLSYPTIPVPELKAYAQGLPYLKFLLARSQEAPLLSPHGVVTVRVPVPERYAIHKLMVSQLRGTVSTKAGKDLSQAATLIEALVDQFPGAIEESLSSIPKSASRFVKRGIAALERHLPASAEAAWDVLRSNKLPR